MEWMQSQEENTISAIVTDPPYGVKEYTRKEIEKKNDGKGGVWRIPPAFDGHKRAPVPRFSIINESPKERERVYDFFEDWGKLAVKVLKPGAIVIMASTPLLSDVVSMALREAGLERRGQLVRVVKTLRGGDRPKGSEEEFKEMSVMPRGVWEPWLLFRKPISEKTVAENLRKWHTGAFRRLPDGKPFVDMIESEKTSRKEREISSHPSLKPQSFMRQMVRAALPMGDGTILDTFSGGGSTIAAAKALGLDAIGLEIDQQFYEESLKNVDLLAAI